MKQADVAGRLINFVINVCVMVVLQYLCTALSHLSHNPRIAMHGSRNHATEVFIYEKGILEKMLQI